MTPAVETMDWLATIKSVSRDIATRGERHEADDSFVADNYETLRALGVFGAGVPAELGGGGAGYREQCALLRELAHHCGSTALALSMHMHQVAIPVWRREHEGAAVDGLLRRVATEQIVLVATGGSDWLESSGRLEKVEGGYRLTGRKIFASGSPAGTLLMTSSVYDDPAAGPMVYHFALPLNAEGVTVQDNWRTLGMRGTGSNDVLIDGAFIAEQAIGVRRPQGSWGVYHTVVMVALPLIYSVYVGIAEAAVDLALAQAAKKRDLPEVQVALGEMQNSLCAAQLALESAIDISTRSTPGPEATNDILVRRTLAGNGAIQAVEKAFEVFGGAALYRENKIERLWRDVQGARFHPLHEKRQLLHTGRHSLDS